MAAQLVALFRGNLVGGEVERWGVRDGFRFGFLRSGAVGCGWMHLVFLPTTSTCSLLHPNALCLSPTHMVLLTSGAENRPGSQGIYGLCEPS